MLVETAIHTIRHARTQYNAEQRYAGTIDVGLSDAGIEEACQAATRLSAYGFDVVITSTLRRAIQTAHLLVPDHAEFVQTKLCNERNFGVLEGLTWSDVQHLEPPILLIQVGNDLHTVNPKGGEPFEEVWQRARRFHRFIFDRYTGCSVLVVSHGVFLQMFHGLLRGLSCIESLAFYPANLELATFRFSGKHLTEQRATPLIGKPEVRW